ncbi:MAG: iron-sulfur cluster assembly scaffold protein [Candidatus Zixiibacteriota bacterium]
MLVTDTLSVTISTLVTDTLSVTISVTDEGVRDEREEISNALGGLPRQKLTCSVLAEAVLKDAIHQYKENYKIS